MSCWYKYYSSMKHTWTFEIDSRSPYFVTVEFTTHTFTVITNMFDLIPATKYCCLFTMPLFFCILHPHTFPFLKLINISLFYFLLFLIATILHCLYIFKLFLWTCTTNQYFYAPCEIERIFYFVPFPKIPCVVIMWGFVVYYHEVFT